MLPKTYAGQEDCSIANALEVLGERWTLLIMRDAFYGVRRFNDFHAHLDAPRTVLSTRLQTLVGAGLLRREPDSLHAGRSLYELTDAGRALWAALFALGAWEPGMPPVGRGRRSPSATKPAGNRWTGPPAARPARSSPVPAT